MDHSQDRVEAAEPSRIDTSALHDPWVLRSTRFDADGAALDQTLFALANGSLGVRGGFEESPSPSDGTFLANVYAQTPIHYHERLPGFARNTDTRVPVAEGKGIEIRLGEKRLDIFDAEWLDFMRELDFRAGCLRRRLRLRTADGATLEIRAERIVPLNEEDLLAIRFVVHSVDYAGPMTLISTVRGGQQAAAQSDDPRIGAGAGEGVLDTGRYADDTWAWLGQSVRDGRLHVVAAQRHVIGGGLRMVGVDREMHHVEQRYEGELTPGSKVILEKFVAYACGESAGGLPERTATVLRRACERGYASLANAQIATLADFWQHADLSISGQPAVEQALRFNLFHLLQSAGRNGIDGTAAKGLTGEGYEGHCFWDTEAFVLPVMVFLAPAVARAMLSFRYRTLDAARAHAKEMNHPRGALYPWRTIAGGECSAHYPSGSAAYHINAAVAYGIGLYLDASDDFDFIAEAGAEILFETARIWPQIGHFNPRKAGAFCLHEVTGPDEYTTLVDNNHYTNRMAKKHLLRAVAVWNRLRMERPQALDLIAGKIGLDVEEVVLWRRAAEAMYLGYDERQAIFAQDDGFLGKPRWPFPMKQSGHRPLLLDYHPLTLYRYQICKQADVVMALVLAGDDTDIACKKRCFDYYEAVTTHDSTLSAPVFGILAAEVGRSDKALHYFTGSLRVDLDDLHGNTGHGVHMAAMAGSWLGLVQGFGGLRVREAALHFSPSLPDGWSRYGFSLQWRKSTLTLDVGSESVVYRMESGAPLTIHHGGVPFELRPGCDVVHPLDDLSGLAKAKYPRHCEALVFDLDGVLTDTAQTHFLAWKRLADEIGVPFDLVVNERLKGVDRMASLDIILERATCAFGADEKNRMAERKNGYYVEAIHGYGPQDLFDGVRELLSQARASGLKIGLASASRNARVLLENLGIVDCFDYIADASSIGRAKPDPEIFLAVANALGVPPAACIGVEDSVAGIEAIHAAGMASIGVGDARTLFHADAVVPAISEFRLFDFISR